MLSAAFDTVASNQSALENHAQKHSQSQLQTSKPAGGREKVSVCETKKSPCPALPTSEYACTCLYVYLACSCKCVYMIVFMCSFIC